MATFSETQDVTAFLKAKGVTKANLAKFSESGKNGVVTDTGLTLRVANKVVEIGKITADMQVSWFTPEDGEPSWMLHTRGESKIEILDTFSI